MRDQEHYQPLDERSSFIVVEAAKRGIDPVTALRVARGEGLGGKIGDGGSSFGDFQLHYGGIAPGGNRVPGLGDDFTRATGLDARDPANWRQADLFALDHAAEKGWGAFHAAAKMGIGPWDGIRTKRMNDGSTPSSSGAGAATPWGGGGWQRNNGATPPGPNQAPSFGAPGPGGSSGRVGAVMDGMTSSSGMGGMPSYQPPQRHPGLLSRLLFGQDGFAGLMPQSMQQHGLIGQFFPHGDAVKPTSDIWGTLSNMPQWQAFAKTNPQVAQMVQSHFSGAQPPAAGQPMQLPGSMPPANQPPLPMMASGQQPQLPASLASLFGFGRGQG